MRATVLPFLALVACNAGSGGKGEPRSEAEPAVEEAAFVLLNDMDRLTRIAMSLKGSRPSDDEIDAVMADPGALDRIVDAYLDDPAFGQAVMEIENESFLFRVERRSAQDTREGMDGESFLTWAEAFYEPPLRIIEHVVTNDLPYSDIVTMNRTMANPYSPYIWEDLDFSSWDPDGPEWQLVPYVVDDGGQGRPGGGILSTGSLHRRYLGNDPNAHRRKTAAMAGALICTDYFNQDVDVGSVDISDDAAVLDAILHEPACVSCHQTMDPMANFFWGFSPKGVFLQDDYPVDLWRSSEIGHRNGDTKAEFFTGRPTGYYGRGGQTMEDLGQHIAGDSRFTTCAARRYWSWFLQVPIDDVPQGLVEDAQAAMLEDGMRIKGMVKHIVLSDRFALSHVADPTESEHVAGYLRTRPRQMSRLMQDLAGFRWEGSMREDQIDLSYSAHMGFAVHAGGIDSEKKTVPSFEYSVTGSAYLRSFAEEAAGHVVEFDFEAPASERQLLQWVEAGTTDEAVLREQLAYLHRRILAELVEVDSPEVDASLALLEQIRTITDDDVTAWKVLLTALFQDVRVAYH